MSDQKKSDSPRYAELKKIADALNQLPSMVRSFGNGLMGTIVLFIGGEVKRTDALEARVAALEEALKTKGA